MINELLKCKTPIDVRDLIMSLGDTVEWLPLGGRKNNISTVNLGSDPAAGLIERITNAMDGVLELKVNGYENTFRTPRQAVEKYFNVDEGRLKNVANFKKIDTSVLSQVKVTLLESGNKKRPTVDIRDNGVGIKNKDFKSTILSLNGNNKTQKSHLMGSFGQGGSTSFSYNDLTLIISRSHIDEAENCSWTLVRINPGSREDKYGWYEYCVDSSTKNPFQFKDPKDTFQPGTLVRHIMMDLGKYSGKITTPSNSLWYLCHNYLFDPILPFTIADSRHGRSESRTVTGNHRLLSKSDNLEYSNCVPVTFKNGKIKFFYWVLKHDGENAKNRIKHYTLSSQPILITLNGQKQGHFSNTLIKEDLKLSFLEKYIIVQVECDNIDNDSKRQLFSTTREKMRETSIYSELKQVLIDTLNEDSQLKQLDLDRRGIYFTRQNESVNINSRLDISAKINGLSKNTSGKSTKLKYEKAKNQPIDINTPAALFERELDIAIEVGSNKLFPVKFRTDADPILFYDPECFYFEFDREDFGYFTGSVRVEDGNGVAYFKVNKHIKSNDISNLTLKLRNEFGELLTLEQTVKFVPKEPDNTSHSDKEVVAEFIYANDPYYLKNEFDSNSVGELILNDKMVVVFVSAEYRNFEKLITRAQRISDTAVLNIRSKYLEHISVLIYMVLSMNTDRVTKKMLLSQMADSCCMLLNEHFNLIVADKTS